MWVNAAGFVIPIPILPSDKMRAFSEKDVPEATLKTSGSESYEYIMVPKLFDAWNADFFVPALNNEIVDSLEAALTWRLFVGLSVPIPKRPLASNTWAALCPDPIVFIFNVCLPLPSLNVILPSPAVASILPPVPSPLT